MPNDYTQTCAVILCSILWAACRFIIFFLSMCMFFSIIHNFLWPYKSAIQAVTVHFSLILQWMEKARACAAIRLEYLRLKVTKPHNLLFIIIKSSLFFVYMLCVFLLPTAYEMKTYPLDMYGQMVQLSVLLRSLAIIYHHFIALYFFMFEKERIKMRPLKLKLVYGINYENHLGFHRQVKLVSIIILTWLWYAKKLVSMRKVVGCQNMADSCLEWRKNTGSRWCSDYEFSLIIKLM